MSVMSVPELAAVLPPGRRVPGLDIGDKTIGMALSDTTRTVASPLDTIKRSKFTADATRLLEVIKSREVGAIIAGLPINMDGSEGPRCQSVRQIGRAHV